MVLAFIDHFLLLLVQSRGKQSQQNFGSFHYLKEAIVTLRCLRLYSIETLLHACQKFSKCLFCSTGNYVSYQNSVSARGNLELAEETRNGPRILDTSYWAILKMSHAHSIFYCCHGRRQASMHTHVKHRKWSPVAQRCCTADVLE